MDVLCSVIDLISSSNFLGVDLNCFLLLLAFLLATDTFVEITLTVFSRCFSELCASCVNTRMFSRIYACANRKNQSRQGEPDRKTRLIWEIFIPSRRDLGKSNEVSVKRAGSLLIQTNDSKNKCFIKKVRSRLGEPARFYINDS